MGMSKDLSQAAAMFFATLIADAWEDEAFKKKLLQNPENVLEERGYGDFRDANGQKVTVKVEEATSGTSCAYDSNTSTLTLFLPDSPDCLKTVIFEGSFKAGMVAPC